MKAIRITSALTTALWLALLSSGAHAVAGVYSWQTNASSVALLRGEQTVWRFNFAATNASKPFFHPLALPGGEALTWQSPDDHVWHYGLWFSWKYLNGVNYWEEDKQTRQSAGTTSWRVTRVETRPDFSARIELDMDYRPRGATNAVLTERRQITVSAPAADGNYALDWRQEFQAGAASVKFDRTPLPGEPGGQVYGGYAGLSLRFAKPFTHTQISASADTGEPRDNRYRFTAAAVDYNGRIGDREYGVAFLEHPANPRHPGRWYAIVNPSQPFAFLNAAWLQLEPYELAAHQKFTLHYRVIVHPDRWGAARLQAEHQKFAAARERAGTHRRVLVFTKNGKGYVHKNIPASVAALRKVCAENAIELDVTDNPAAFTEDNLKQYKALIFSNTNNELFDHEEQKVAFQKFIRAGGGFVGIHSACGSERQWPWFWSLIGCKFVRHPKIQPFTIKVCDRQHPSTAHLGETWEWTDEFYYLDHLNPGMRVLLSGDRAKLDDSNTSQLGDQINGESPLAWCFEFEGGRTWFTALGHSNEAYSDPQFTRHILGGILWAMGENDLNNNR